MNLTAKSRMPESENALPGRAEAMPVALGHFLHGRPMVGPFEAPLKQIQIGMGCFWGAERRMWEMPGVYTTAVGYAGGLTPNPTYREVCSGGTGHTEVVLVVFDERLVSLEEILKVFWEAHDPTQGMRQGNDLGTQYRSAIYVYDDEQLERVQNSRDQFQQALIAVGYGAITTEIRKAPPFYYAEDYHQQYLAKVPNGYCGLRGTGAICSVEPSGADAS